MQGAVRRVTTTAALTNAEGPLGAWAMSLHGFLAEVRLRRRRTAQEPALKKCTPTIIYNTACLTVCHGYVSWRALDAV